MSYNYKEGKKRILEILNDENDIKQVDTIPQDSEFTYDNGYYGWVTSLFVDIRKSTELFSENKKSSTARIIRSFTSEIIEILHSDNNLREIGIRGDCVYAIYTTPSKEDIDDVCIKGYLINSFLDMLNKLLENKKMKTIKAGIGISSAQDLVVKAGRKNTGINSKVWIGKAVTYASKLSNLANSNSCSKKLLMSDITYNNVIEILKKRNSEKNVYSWFTKYNSSELGTYYGCNVVCSDFDNWVNGGMKDE
jgi:class 3 adenylate cyclase